MAEKNKNSRIRGLYLGKVEFEGMGGFPEKMISQLLELGVKLRRVRFKDGKIYGTVSPDEYYITAKTAKKYGVRIRSGKRSGIYFTAARYSGRLGLYVGLLIFGVIISFCQSTVADISISGDVSKEQVLNILESCGIKEGVSTHGLDTIRAERRIMLEVKDTSWVDVTCDGYRVNVTVEKVAAPPEMVENDKPCNIIASKDAMIYDHTVRQGALCVETGNGVAKGTLLVSGVVTDEQGNVSFHHSSAEIIGEFNETQEFFVPFSELVKTPDGEQKQYKYLVFLDDIYPLFFGKAGAENSVYSEETHIVSFLGQTMPFKIKIGTFTKYRDNNVTRSSDDCVNELKKLKTDFEENFYSDYEIVKAEEKYSPESEGIRLVIDYTLRGNIAEEQEIEIS